MKVEEEFRYNIGSIEGFEVLIPTMSAVTADIMDSGPSLQLIQQCGAGLDTVDLEAAMRNQWPNSAFT